MHEAKVQKHNISLKIKSPQIISQKLKVENYEGYLVDSGAKHFCIWVNNLEEIKNIESICKNIRYSKEFMPIGVNVNFFEIICGDLIFKKILFFSTLASCLPSPAKNCVLLEIIFF